jgi:hypothetical protein
VSFARGYDIILESSDFQASRELQARGMLNARFWKRIRPDKRSEVMQAAPLKPTHT